MDDRMEENDPNDYPDPGSSSRNPYPAIAQPEWGPYGSTPRANGDTHTTTGDPKGSQLYPDLDGDHIIGP